jgi:hypothetical protein
MDGRALGDAVTRSTDGRWTSIQHRTGRTLVDQRWYGRANLQKDPPQFRAGGNGAWFRHWQRMVAHRARSVQLRTRDIGMVPIAMVKHFARSNG